MNKNLCEDLEDKAKEIFQEMMKVAKEVDKEKNNR